MSEINRGQEQYQYYQEGALDGLEEHARKCIQHSHSIKSIVVSMRTGDFIVGINTPAKMPTNKDLQEEAEKAREAADEMRRLADRLDAVAEFVEGG